jgi:hypothetical protein
MGDMVHVPFGDNRAETATLLLDAAEKSKDHEQSVVAVDHYNNTFVVPEEIAKSAGLKTVDPDADFAKEVEAARKAAETKEGKSGELLSVSGYEVEGGQANQQKAQAESEEAPAPAKKAAAKKTTAKKAAAKKTAAKKS